jgi:protein-disulfide isomerase
MSPYSNAEQAATAPALQPTVPQPRPALPQSNSKKPPIIKILAELLEEMESNPNAISTLFGSDEGMERMQKISIIINAEMQKKAQEEFKKAQEEQIKKLAKSSGQWIQPNSPALVRSQNAATLLAIMTLDCPHCRTLMDNLIEWSNKATPDKAAATIIPWFFSKAPTLPADIDKKMRAEIETSVAKKSLFVKALMIAFAQNKASPVWEKVKEEMGKEPQAGDINMLKDELAKALSLPLDDFEKKLNAPELTQSLDKTNQAIEELKVSAMPMVVMMKKGTSGSAQDMAIHLGSQSVEQIDQIIESQEKPIPSSQLEQSTQGTRRSAASSRG